MSNASRESAFATGDNETLIWIDESCLCEDRTQWEREGKFVRNEKLFCSYKGYVCVGVDAINSDFEIGCDIIDDKLKKAPVNFCENKKLESRENV